MKVFGNGFPPSKIFMPKAMASWRIGDMIGRGDYDNVALASFSVVDRENIDVRRCFQETNHIFAFGRDIVQSVVTIDMVMFLGSACGGSSGSRLGGLSSLGGVGLGGGVDNGGGISKPRNGGGSLGINELRRLYNDNRVSSHVDPHSVVVGDFSFRGFIVQMNIEGIDPSRHLCTVSLMFIVDQER